MNKLELPVELEEHREALERSVKPYIKITEHEAETTPYQSKLGGYPYYPKDLAYPVGSEGQVMRLLVQLNFIEMPHLEGFPTEGILQIYIPADDDMYGCDYGDGDDEHQVIYHDKVIIDDSLLMSVFPYILEGGPYFPIDNESELSLRFEPKEEMIPNNNANIIKYLDTDGWDDDKLQTYYDFSPAEGIKVGGYPGFTQVDPRERNSKYNTLLFQLDSQTDGDGEIEIGDCGIMNFFINKEKLTNCDFTDVLYNWDCG